MPPERVTHEVLLERVQAGDREALSELIERFWRPLVAYATSILGSADDAEDIAQDVFVLIWQRPLWVPAGSASAYLYKITRNRALNLLRDKNVETRSRDSSTSWRTAAQCTPEDDLVTRSLRRRVESAIANLPERRRQAFILARYHRLTHREIAEVMGISPQTVANQISAAIDELRSTLADVIDSI